MTPLIVPISELRNNLSYYAHLAKYKGKHIRVQKNKKVLFDIIPPESRGAKTSDYKRIFDSYVGVWSDLSTHTMLESILALRKKSAQELSKTVKTHTNS